MSNLDSKKSMQIKCMLLLKKIIIKRNTQKHLKNKGLRYTLFCYIFLKVIIKLYRSSTVGLNLDGYKLLMDPWLTDGEYYGAWSHFPYFDFDKNLDEINSYNAIYISHIHPDHCSEDTLIKINKNFKGRKFIP